jgi:hypothetical protein
LFIITTITIIIIVVVVVARDELRLDKPVSFFLIVSSKVFQGVFVHLVYNSALFLAPCCCLFLLHVVANLICVFLVSLQLVLLSALQIFFIPFVVKQGLPGCVKCFW